MKLNQDKCHLLIAGHKYEHIWMNAGENKIRKSSSVNLLGIKNDSKFKFDLHIRNISKKPTTNCLFLLECFLLLLFYSQFFDCTLVYMFCSRSYNQTTRIIVEDCIQIFKELLKRDRSITLHTKNLQLLAIEMYQCIKLRTTLLLPFIFPFNIFNKS